jgi:hypothetical protein
MKIVVKRKRWLRGEPSSCLLEDGRRCCIGFACQQLGVPDTQIYLMRRVHDAREKYDRNLVPELGPDLCESGFLMQAYALNDSENISDWRREKLLKELALKYGHEFVFVD